MDINIKKAKKIIQFMRKEGVSHLKTSELDVTISLNHLPPKKKSKKESYPEEEKIKNNYTEEEVLFWSSPGMLDEVNHS